MLGYVDPAKVGLLGWKSLSARSALIAVLATGLAALSGAVQQASAQDIVASERGPIRVDTLVEGLRHPWGFDFLPDGSMVVTERQGRLNWVAAESYDVARIDGLPPIADGGQGGLMDVAVDPDFAANQTLYLTFSEAGSGGVGTSAVRARLVGLESGAPQLQDVEVIFRMAPKSRGGRHFGSRVVIAPDGTLFITLGDRGDPDRSQDPGDHAGSVIRINKDGSVPDDNPYLGQAGYLPELWSIGHRNIQGADIDPDTGLLWTVEHGARGGDEINQPQPGLNYGWPIISYGRQYSGGKIGIGSSAEGYEQPNFYWDPSIAPSGLAVYDGDLFPEWRGDLLVGALKFQLLSRLEREADTMVKNSCCKAIMGASVRSRSDQMVPSILQQMPETAKFCGYPRRATRKAGNRLTAIKRAMSLVNQIRTKLMT